VNLAEQAGSRAGRIGIVSINNFKAARSQ
jgi:hypothetical protein